MDRQQKIDAFYNDPKNKDKYICDNCLRPLLLEELMQSTETAGLRLCPLCLEEDIKKTSKPKCEICGQSGLELCGVEDSSFKNVCIRCFKNTKGGGEKNNMGTAGDFAKRNSQYISLNDGESAVGVYKDCQSAPNPFDPDKEVMNYKIETDYGIKTLRSGACGLARLFDQIPTGTEIKFTRSGTGNKTSYSIEQKDTNDEWIAVGKEVED